MSSGNLIFPIPFLQLHVRGFLQSRFHSPSMAATLKTCWGPATTSSIRWWLEVLWRRGLFPSTCDTQKHGFPPWDSSGVRCDSMDQPPQRTGPTRPSASRPAFAHAPRATLEAREHVPGISCSINLRDQRRGTMLDMGYRGWSHRCLGPYNGGCLILGGDYFHFNWLVSWAQLLGKKRKWLVSPYLTNRVATGAISLSFAGLFSPLHWSIALFFLYPISLVDLPLVIGLIPGHQPASKLELWGVKHRGRFLRMLPSWLWLITMAIVIFSLWQFRGAGNGNSKSNVEVLPLLQTEIQPQSI